MAFSRARETSEAGVYKVVVEYKEEELARACLETAVNCAWPRPTINHSTSPPAIKKLEDMAHEVCLGPSTAAIARAAHARGIPVRRLNAGSSLVQLGYGARGSGAFAPPRPIAPAPLPSRSHKTKN